MALPLRGKKSSLRANDFWCYLAGERLGLTTALIEQTRARFAAACAGWPARIEASFLSAEMKTSNPHPYTARVSTQVILSDKATGTDLHGPARDIGAFNGEIGQYNGSNCLPNRSLETHKYGTLRILKRTAEAFVNLVVTSAAPPPEAGQPRIAPKASDAVKVDSGKLGITRFPPGAMR